MSTDPGFSVDSMESARGFLKMDDLEGRLLVIKPLDTGERESNLPGQAGKMYQYVVCDIVVCDGEIDDRIGDEIPGQLDRYQLSGATVVGQLEPKIGKGKVVVGRLEKKAASRKGFSPTWYLTTPTPDEMTAAKAAIVAIQTTKADSPFD
jgi:hypothetical protein